MSSATYETVMELAEHLTLEEQHQLAIKLLARVDRTAVQRQWNQAAIDLLDTWEHEGDSEEQRETLHALQQALDEDRPSYRTLFS